MPQGRLIAGRQSEDSSPFEDSRCRICHAKSLPLVQRLDDSEVVPVGFGLVVWRGGDRAAYCFTPVHPVSTCN
jgi:hypothetical protein